jgi:hypothetical protein
MLPFPTSPAPPSPTPLANSLMSFHDRFHDRFKQEREPEPEFLVAPIHAEAAEETKTTIRQLYSGEQELFWLILTVTGTLIWTTPRPLANEQCRHCKVFIRPDGNHRCEQCGRIT